MSFLRHPLRARQQQHEALKHTWILMEWEQYRKSKRNKYCKDCGIITAKLKGWIMVVGRGEWVSTVTVRMVAGSEWWDYHPARSAAALQRYTDPHSQVPYTVFVIALALSHRLVISLASSLVVGNTLADGLPEMQMASFNLRLLLWNVNTVAQCHCHTNSQSSAPYQVVATAWKFSDSVFFPLCTWCWRHSKWLWPVGRPATPVSGWLIRHMSHVKTWETVDAKVKESSWFNLKGSVFCWSSE